MIKIVVEDIQRCIDYGADVAVVLHEQFFPDTPWTVAYRPIAEILTTIKQLLREMLPYTSEDALLLTMKGYSGQDLADVYACKDANDNENKKTH